MKQMKGGPFTGIIARKWANFPPTKNQLQRYLKHNAYYQKNIDAEYSRSSSCDQTKWITNKSSLHAIQLG